MKIAYLGPKRTFTEKVARNLFPQEELVPLQSIRKVIMGIEKGNFEKGVVPLENLYNGSVIHTLDSLTRCDQARIVQETSSKIVHCFGALKGHLPIKKIYSKDQALEQCDDYLAERFPDAITIATTSTSEAVEFVSRVFSQRLSNLRKSDWTYCIDNSELDNIYSPEESIEFSKKVLEKIRLDGFDQNLFGEVKYAH